MGVSGVVRRRGGRVGGFQGRRVGFKGRFSGGLRGFNGFKVLKGLIWGFQGLRV